MSDCVINAEGLSKKFILNHQGVGRYTSFRDVMASSVGKIFNNRDKAVLEDFWALKDVNFEVRRGERLGIIGRNGAGKSTLLKILSRISEPTSGRVTIDGRVASLLEVGTGFHPELTGRENIFLNGSILGMSRVEIRKKFDEIVEFAEVEKFLDTPVKRYSSGMYVRLAFAVAAHLEPEILIVDEVLAVGDAQFQKKCLGKMEDISKNDGRTLLFVSHNTAALLSLCNRGVVLSQGLKLFEGDIVSAVNAYSNSALRKGFEEPRSLSANISIERFTVDPDEVKSLNDASIRLRFAVGAEEEQFKSVVLTIAKDGKRIAIADLREVSDFKKVAPHSNLDYHVRIKSLPLIEGEYSIGIYLEATSISGDFVDLTNFTVLPRSRTLDFTPYDISVRGVIELSIENELTTIK